MEKRKITFWTCYILIFAVLFIALRSGYYSFVNDSKWADAIFVILLFIIVSPLSTFGSMKITSLFLGPEDK